MKKTLYEKISKVYEGAVRSAGSFGRSAVLAGAVGLAALVSGSALTGCGKSNVVDPYAKVVLSEHARFIMAHDKRATYDDKGRGIISSSISKIETKEDGRTIFFLADYFTKGRNGPHVMLTKEITIDENNSKDITLFDYLRNNSDENPGYDEGSITITTKDGLKIIEINKSELKELGNKLFREISSEFSEEAEDGGIGIIDANSADGKRLKKEAIEELIEKSR